MADRQALSSSRLLAELVASCPDGPRLYDTSAEFRAGVTLVAHWLPKLVEMMAGDAELADMRRRQAEADLLFGAGAGPGRWRVVMDDDGRIVDLVHVREGEPGGE